MCVYRYRYTHSFVMEVRYNPKNIRFTYYLPVDISVFLSVENRIPGIYLN
jgi:predicted Holliday junction resolvase-like endonuclease